MDNTETSGKLVWETPTMEVLVVEQTAIQPGVGTDGGVADCSRS